MDAEVSGNYVTLLSSHKNLKSLDSYKAASVKHQQKMFLILSCSCEQSTSSSSVSHLVQESSIMPVNPPKGVDPNKLFKPAGVFTGTCISKIDGCSFTFNIHHEKKKAQSQQSPRREGLSSAMIQFRLVNWAELNLIQVLWKSTSIEMISLFLLSFYLNLPPWQVVNSRHSKLYRPFFYFTLCNWQVPDPVSFSIKKGFKVCL